MQDQIIAPTIVTAVPLPSNDKLEIVIGEAAFRLIHDQAFIQGWDILYNACPWATIFQEKKFAILWYEFYNSQFTPIIVSNWYKGKLTGLILLALNNKDKKIQGAGADIAYYKTWLTTESSNAFIKASLRKLIAFFPGHIISLSQLPPNTPISWIEEDPYFRKRCVFRPISRPLVKLKEKGIEKLFSKKDFRENCNRLKRLGELSYERVCDFDSFSDIIDELTYQYDFRQGATRNLTPYRNSPLRKQLLVEMFHQNMLHVTLLKLNNEIIASLIATKDREGWIHGVGLNSHSPFYGSYSPGFVCFVKFMQMLIHEGYDTLNLATGNQPYKARLANKYDQVYELTITDKSLYISKEIIKSILRKHLKPNLKKLLKQSKTYFSQTIQKFKIIRNQGLMSYSSHHLKNINQTLHAFRTDQEHHESGNTTFIKMCSLQDLLCFDETKAFISQQEFFSDAMKRFDYGEKSFTWVEDGKLLACAWLLGPNRSKKDKRVLIFPDDCAIIHGVYHHPQIRDRLDRFLNNVKLEASRLCGPVSIYIKVSNADAKLSKILIRSAI